MRPHAWSESDLESSDRLDVSVLPKRGFSPAAAGALAGVLGGILVVVALRLCDPALVAFVTEERWLRQFEPNVAQSIAAASLLLVSALLGAIFASITRRLRRFSHAAIWSILFFGSVWICAGALIAKRAPQLATLLPFAPLLGVTAAYALALALHVPLRGGRSR